MSEKLKEIVTKINAAFTSDDPEGFLFHCADDIEWTMVGHTTVKGKTAISEFLSDSQCEPPVFSVDGMYAGEDSVTCFGGMTMKDKDGTESPYSYCDVYRFSADKITSLHSFIVKHQTEGEQTGTAAA